MVKGDHKLLCHPSSNSLERVVDSYAGIPKGRNTLCKWASKVNPNVIEPLGNTKPNWLQNGALRSRRLIEDKNPLVAKFAFIRNLIVKGG